MEHGDHRFRWFAVLGVVMLVGCYLAAAGLTSWFHAESSSAPTRTSGSPYLVEPFVQVQRTAAHPRPRRSPAAGQPTRLVVPRLHVDAPVLPIDTQGDVLIPPSDPQQLGWWRKGAVPGAAHGGALITGHTVHTGGGAFDDLDTLRAGDEVTVRTTAGRVRYVVSGVTVYRKSALARNAAHVFRQDGPGRLVLITCEDWNGTTYLSNAVVFADPV